MVDLKKRILPKGTIVKFPEFGLHILAHIGDRYFNFIGLGDGQQKTKSWHHDGQHDEVEIPERTWFNGGPPIVIHVPNNYGDEDDKIMNIISSDEIKHRNRYVKNYNKKMMQCIKDALL